MGFFLYFFTYFFLHPLLGVFLFFYTFVGGCMSCYNCRFYSGEGLLPCAVDPSTASNSPMEGCKDWEPNPNPNPTPNPTPTQPQPHILEVLSVLCALIVPPLVLGFLIYRAYNPVEVKHPLEVEVLIIKPE